MHASIQISNISSLKPQNWTKSHFWGDSEILYIIEDLKILEIIENHEFI